jgi:hypothetical protein
MACWFPPFLLEKESPMRRLLFPAVLMLLAAWYPLHAGDGKKKGDPPGEAHENMAKHAGEYTTATKFTTPDGKVVEGKGTAKLTSILGGRFVQEENTGKFSDTQFTGLRLFGFNNATGKYEAIWTYSGSTAMMKLVGEQTADKTVQFKGTIATGKEKDKKKTFTIVYHIMDDGFTVELTEQTPDGKGPRLETTYTRKR